MRISSRAIIIHENNILLNELGDGLYYNFPGGQIEENETAPEAVLREVLEETGISVEAPKYVCTFEYESAHCNNCEGEGHRLSLFFRCKVTGSTEIHTPEIPDRDPDDSSIQSKAKWVPLSQLGTKSIVPAVIYEPLLKYIESGVFEPCFIEYSDHM